MAKDMRGDRGLQGIPGPAGPAGPTGAIGVQGNVGQRGLIGKTGARGAKGTVGAKGAMGKQGTKGQELPRRRKLFGLVQIQIDRIDRELQIQMTRMAQIQAEIDQLRANLRRLASDSN